MTNPLANRPAYIGSATTLNISGGMTSSQPPRISLDGGKFTLMDELGDTSGEVAPSLTLDVVIVGVNDNVSQVYYEPKKPGEKETFDKPPLCFSDNGKAPSERSLEPQHPTCGGCPKKAWTNINTLGNKVPWCQSRKKLALLVAGAGETVFLLSVPPKSHKDAGDGKGMTLAPYHKFLDGQHPPVPAQCVITRLTIVDRMLRFECVGWVPESSMAFIRETVAGDLPANVVNAFDRPISGMPATTAGLKAVAEAVQITPENPQLFGAVKHEAVATLTAAETLERKTFNPAITIPAQQFSPESSGPAKISFSMSSTPAPEDQPRGRGRPRAQQSVGFEAAAPVGGFEAAVHPGPGQQQGPSFGMVSDAPAPPDEVQKKLDNVFARFGPK